MRRPSLDPIVEKMRMETDHARESDPSRLLRQRDSQETRQPMSLHVRADYARPQGCQGSRS
jgi:hypothetical protein